MSRFSSHRPRSGRQSRGWGLSLLLCAAAALPCLAGLTEYDAAVTADAAAGLIPAARLTEAATFLGNDSLAFDFGNVTGDGTFECVAEATGEVSSGYLAIGEDSLSNLRLQQWPGTGQVGMTRTGVADYLFTPPVSSPAEPSVLAYVWDGAGTMRLYVNGTLAGTCTGVTPDFGLPSGAGRLGSNPFNGEGMSGTVYRVACYDSMLSPETLRRRGEAFQGVKQGPVIQSLTATPATVTEGNPVTLAWQVTGADSLTLDGADVTGLTEKSLTPAATATHILKAVSATGAAEASVTVTVTPVIITNPGGHVVINEFMASNTSTLADSDGEFSDWLELHNPTAAPVNLGGWFLTDKAPQPRQWALPAEDLPPGGYRVVFLSGKDKITPGGEWHSNFKLGKEGEYLALTGPEGVVHAFAPSFPAQDDDVSYGLTGGDPQSAGYLGRPTPGAANDPSPPKPARITFSEAGGLLRAPVTVTLSCATAGSEIRYQINKTAEAVYTAPLTVGATTRLRAWAVRLGQKGPESQVLWVRPAASLANYTSPLPIMVIDNFASGPVPQKGWSGDGSGIRQVARQSAAWVTWDRAGTAAAIADEPRLFTGIGIRGRGAYSSSWKQKPYSVEARDETGADRDVEVLGMPAHSDWIFYFPDPEESKDPTLLFNTFVYDLSRRLGHAAPRFRWVELFVNEDGGDVALTDRRGVYAVLEKVSRSPDRLDFDKLSADGAQGGWLLSLNRMDAIPETGWPAANGVRTPQFFRTAGANRVKQTQPNNPATGGDDEPQQSNGFLNFDNPGGYDINPAQRASIEGWFKSFEDALYGTFWRDPAIGYRKWLDDRDFAEYFVFNELTKNGDGLLISMYPWKGRDGRLRMGPTWDYNYGSYYVGGNASSDLRWRGDRLWYRRLFADQDFMQLYTDRWFAFRAGAMSNAGMAAIIDGQAAEITPAKAVAQGISSAAGWQSRLTQMKNWLTTRANWVDAQYVIPPVLSVPGGIVPSGQTVGITVTSGAPYHTVDGGDPRVYGGGISPAARTGSAVTVSGDVRLTVRSRATVTRWSAPTMAVYVTDAAPASAGNLVFSEIHYHPADPSPAETAAGFTDSGDFEFVELLNPGTGKVSLSGLKFTAGPDGQGIRYAFDDGALWSLAPGARMVIVKNAAAFTLRYGPGLPVAGAYTGNLSNSGDTLTLTDAAGAVIRTLTYGDAPPWPAEADGPGRSLTLLGDTAPAEAAAAGSWRASVASGGSPGTSDSVPAPPPGGDPEAYAFGAFPLTWSWLEGAATVSRRRVPGSDAVTVGLEHSPDLNLWTPVGGTETSGTVEADGSVTVSRRLPPGTKGFIRWRVTRRTP